MVRPNFIPRTRRGVGGIRLFDIPGVIYPKEVLVPKPGLNHKDGLPYREAPCWGITSREAATMLGCSPAAARTWLHRRKVPYRIVGEEGQTLRIFWRKERVMSLAEKRLPIIHKCPARLISAMEALSILHVGRSSLHRYQERGLLSVVKVRHPSDKGLRKCSYFVRKEVEQLAEHLAVMREKEAELSRIRSKSRPNPSTARRTSKSAAPSPRKSRKKKCT